MFISSQETRDSLPSGTIFLLNLSTKPGRTHYHKVNSFRSISLTTFLLKEYLEIDRYSHNASQKHQSTETTQLYQLKQNMRRPSRGLRKRKGGLKAVYYTKFNSKLNWKLHVDAIWWKKQQQTSGNLKLHLDETMKLPLTHTPLALCDGKQQRQQTESSVLLHPAELTE